VFRLLSLKHEKPAVRILGVVGSPRKGFNTEIMVNEALKAAKEAGDVDTELLRLADLDINFCKGDVSCLKTKRCIQNDSMNGLYKKLVEEIDGFIFGSPVYFKSMTGQLKTFIDRLQPIVTVDYMGLLNKPATVLTVGYGRNGGQELAIKAIEGALLDCGMIIVGGDITDGRGAWSGTQGGGYNVIQVQYDERGLKYARACGRRVAEIAISLKIGLPYTRYVTDPSPGIPKKYPP